MIFTGTGPVRAPVEMAVRAGEPVGERARRSDREHMGAFEECLAWGGEELCFHDRVMGSHDLWGVLGEFLQAQPGVS